MNSGTEVGPTIQSAWTGIPASASYWGLRNLAENFGSDHNSLLDETKEVADLVGARLQLLRTMREARVRNFAARQLEGISPVTLVRLRKVIDERLGSGGFDGGS